MGFNGQPASGNERVYVAP